MRIRTIPSDRFAAGPRMAIRNRSKAPSNGSLDDSNALAVEIHVGETLSTGNREVPASESTDDSFIA